MKKVLIIGYYFSYNNHVGSRRLRGLAKFLPEFGWEPTILTVKNTETSEGYPRNQKIIEIPHEDIISLWKRKARIPLEERIQKHFNCEKNKFKRKISDKVIDFWEEVFAYPDGQKSWLYPTMEVCNELLDDEYYDAIISTSGPYTSHLIANKLKSKYGYPWIADLRDLWTQHHAYPHSPIRKSLEKKLEVETLRSADALVTVSKPLGDELKELHKNKPIYIILNGFDPDEKSKDDRLSSKFNIVYSGTIYKLWQDPRHFFAALQKLVSDGSIDPNCIEVDFYCPFTDGWLQRDIEMYNLQKFVTVRGFISRNELLGIQRAAQILLLFGWNDPKGIGVYTGKIFEYLAAKRPILALGISGSVVEMLLSETNAGIYVSTQDDLEKTLRRSYDEFSLTGRVSYNGIQLRINNYSLKETAKKFAAVLNKVSTRGLPSDPDNISSKDITQVNVIDASGSSSAR